MCIKNNYHKFDGMHINALELYIHAEIFIYTTVIIISSCIISKISNARNKAHEGRRLLYGMGKKIQESARADTLSKKARRERVMVIVTILLALFIILSMMGILVIILILEPEEVAEVIEKDGINIAEILAKAAQAMNGG